MKKIIYVLFTIELLIVSLLGLNIVKDNEINNILYKIFVSEKKRLCKQRSFPFGVSLICVARNNKEGIKWKIILKVL